MGKKTKCAATSTKEIASLVGDFHGLLSKIQRNIYTKTPIL